MAYLDHNDDWHYTFNTWINIYTYNFFLLYVATDRYQLDDLYYYNNNYITTTSLIMLLLKLHKYILNKWNVLQLIKFKVRASFSGCEWAH